MQMSFDTQSTFSILAKDKVEELGLTMGECNEVVCLLTIGSEGHEAPVEGLVQVDWHLVDSAKTYTTTFRVVAMTNFDVLLGRDAINEHGFVVMRLPHHRGVARTVR